LNSASNRPSEQAADDRAGGDELEPAGQPACAVPAADPVRREELAPARPRQRQDMLEVGCGRGAAADHGRVERTARGREQPEQREPGPDLEAARADVAVRDAVAEEV